MRLDVEAARGSPARAVPLAGCRALACYATDVSLHCAGAPSHHSWFELWSSHTALLKNVVFLNTLQSANWRILYFDHLLTTLSGFSVIIFRVQTWPHKNCNAECMKCSERENSYANESLILLGALKYILYANITMTKRGNEQPEHFR